MLLFCNNLTDAILQQIALGVKLEHAELDGNRNLSDAGISALVTSSTGMRSLSLSFCQRVTNAALVDISLRLPDLETLRLLVSWFSPDCVSRVRKALPQCHISYLPRDSLQAKALDLYGGFGSFRACFIPSFVPHAPLNRFGQSRQREF